MLKKLLVTSLAVLAGSVYADDCATRVITDRLADRVGNEIVSEQSRTSCGNMGNLTQLVGIDQRCYPIEYNGNPSLACQYPGGRWEVVGDPETFDVFAGPNTPNTGNYNINNNYIAGPAGFIVYFANLWKWGFGRLDNESKNLHATTVFLTLERAQNGELVTWQNPKDSSWGRMKVVKTVPVNGGVCRTILMQVVKGSHAREMSEVACYNNSTNKWNFV